MDEPQEPDLAQEPDEPQEPDETEADAKLRAQLEGQAASFRSMTDSLKLGDAVAAQLKAFQGPDFKPFGERFRKLEADRAALMESMVGPASRIQAEIDAMTRATKGLIPDYSADIRGLPAGPGIADAPTPWLDIEVVRPYSEVLLEGVRDDLGALVDGTVQLAQLNAQLLAEAKASAKRERRAVIWAVLGWVVATVVTLVLGYLQLQKP